jgi:uncharacterized protein YjbI with pentapeptide repeats
MASPDRRVRGDVREAWVLRHLGLVLAAGAIAVALVLVLGLFFAPKWGVLVDQRLTGAPRSTAEDAVRSRALGVATVIGAAIAGALAWGRLDLSRQENRRSESLLATDRYTRAIEQLGSADAAVRLGALYALEALAHDSPTDRVTIAEVICAYVRHHTVRREHESSKRVATPSSSDASADIAAPSTTELRTDGRAVDYRAAIAIALRLPASWRLPVRDLRGIVAVDLDVVGCELGAVDFRGSHFLGKTWFYGATFRDTALFNEAVFEGGADFGRAVFDDRVDFSFTEFRAPERLDNYQRHRAGSPWFMPNDESSRGIGRRWHEGHEGVRFSHAVFGGDASFVDTRFECWGCHFENTEVQGSMTFEPRELDYCSFERARFMGSVEFYFPHGFEKVHFGDSVFARGASFNMVGNPGGFERRPCPDGTQRWFRAEHDRVEAGDSLLEEGTTVEE